MLDEKDMKESIQEVESQDDVEQVKQQLTSAEREIEAFEKALESKKEGKERYIGQVARQKKIRELQIANYRKVEPTFEFEKLDEYWELQVEELADKMREEEQVGKGTVERFDLEIEQIESTIENNKEKITRLQALLGDEE